MKHMIIGDAHAKPGISNRRFEWAGHLAIEEKPDIIIDMGDWFDMPSLSSYDIGKKSFEGRRYAKDIRAGQEANELFLKPIHDYNRRNPKEPYNPKLVALGGNHCAGRILRTVEAHPELEGTISVDDTVKPGWIYQPFLESLNLGGIMYSHYFISGIMGRPVGGEHPAASLLSKMHTSCVSAHSHLWDYAERVRADHKRICALVAGCFLEHREGYAGPANHMWWRGITFANNVKEGYFDPGRVSLAEMRKRYA